MGARISVQVVDGNRTQELVKFIKHADNGKLLIGLKENESYMCASDGESDLIKVLDTETGPDKFGSLTNKEFRKSFSLPCGCGDPNCPTNLK